MIADLVSRYDARRRIVPWLLWAMAFFLIVWFIRGGRYYELATLVAVAYAGVFLLRWPIVGVMLLIVGFAGKRGLVHFLGFLPSHQVPFIGTIYPTDIILSFTLLASWRSLAHRGERPRFLVPLAYLFGIAIVSNLNGMIAGDVTYRSVLRGFRNYQMVYFVYLASVGVLDSRKKLHLVFMTMMLMVLYGIVWRQLPVLRSTPQFYQQGIIEISGRPVVYSRTGVDWLSLLAALVCLAQVVEGSRRGVFVLLTLATGTSLLFTLVRTGFVMLAIGTLTIGLLVVLMNTSGYIRRTLNMVLAAVALVLFLVAVSPVVQTGLGDTAINTILDRASTILAGTSEPNVAGRLDIAASQARVWLSAPNPLLGYGFSASLYEEGLNYDTGVWNTMVLLGPLGVLTVVILWWTVMVAGCRLYRLLSPSLERGYVLGAVAFWTTLVVAYLFGLDFFTYPTIEIPLVMIFLDRVEAFTRQSLVPTEESPLGLREGAS